MLLLVILLHVSFGRPEAPGSAAHVLCTTRGHTINGTLLETTLLQKTLNDYNLIFHEVMHANEAAVSSPEPNVDACLTRSVDQT